MARKHIVEVEGVPPSPSPISNAVVVGKTCWISGQLSVRPNGYIPGTAREEAEIAFGHIFRLAAAASFDRTDIVYVDLAFADLGDLKEVNVLYGQLFDEGRRPARTVYQAARLPFGGKVKVQAIAAKGPKLYVRLDRLAIRQASVIGALQAQIRSYAARWDKVRSKS